MTRPIEELLRETVRELAGEAGPATDLATGARVRGRRLRRRRRVGLIAAAVLLVALTTVPYALLRDTALPVLPPGTRFSPTPATPSTTWSTAEPFRLPGGAVVTGVGTPNPNGTAENLVLERNARQYKALPELMTSNWPSPSGLWVAVRDDSRREPFGVRRISTGKVRWLPSAGLSSPVWSPDGGRLMLTTGDGGFLIADAATGRTAEHTVDPTEFACTEVDGGGAADVDQPQLDPVCDFSWLPSGDQVARALTAGDRSATRQDSIRGLAIFTVATGAPVRTVPVPGAPVGQDAWSPDGRLVLITPATQETGDLRIAEVESGRVLAGLPAWKAVFLADGSVLGLGDGTATRYDATGRTLQQQILPSFLAQREFSIGPGS